MDSHQARKKRFHPLLLLLCSKSHPEDNSMLLELAWVLHCLLQIRFLPLICRNLILPRKYLFSYKNIFCQFFWLFIKSYLSNLTELFCFWITHRSWYKSITIAFKFFPTGWTNWFGKNITRNFWTWQRLSLNFIPDIIWV